MTQSRVERLRVLIISFSYAPSITPRAFRWTALAEHWAHMGHEVVVVSAWSPGLLRQQSLNGVEVHRAGSSSAEAIRAAMARMRMDATPQADNRRRNALGPAAQLVATLWRYVYWPDTSCLWFPAALRTARRLALKPKVVVSVSPTFTGVAVGNTLLAGMTPRPAWLIDLGDPFSIAHGSPPNNARLYGRLNRRFEGACLRRADAIAVTTENTASRYEEAFSESAYKLNVIPPLLSVPRSALTPMNAHGERRMVFLGRLYNPIRRPDFLLALFSALRERQTARDLTLHFYGEVGECRDDFALHAPLLDRSVFLHGLVPREAALEAMRSATVLVNLGNESPDQLPSKLIEYAATGRAILNIVSCTDDRSAAALRNYPLHLTLHADRAAPNQRDIEAVESLLAQAAQPLDPSEVIRWLSPYELETISAAYLRAIDTAIRRRGGLA